MGRPTRPAVPHLPSQVVIDAYGNGGFRFAGMSHRGSLLCLPDGIWAWPFDEASELSEPLFKAVFAQAGAIDIFLIGCGRSAKPMPIALKTRFRDTGISADTMPTGAAVRIYNILLGERRRVAAGLVAVA